MMVMMMMNESTDGDARILTPAFQTDAAAACKARSPMLARDVIQQLTSQTQEIRRCESSVGAV